MERFSGGAPLCSPREFEFEFKILGISRVKYQMINKKCNCGNEISSQKLAVPLNSTFWKNNSCEKL